MKVVGSKAETKAVPSESILNPAHVTVGGSLTRNLGDFESVKVSVSLTRPCLDTGKHIERVYQECSAWVDAKIAEEMKKV